MKADPVQPTPLMSVEELCAALRTGGFVLTAESRTTLSLRPRAGCTEAMAKAIQRYKHRLTIALFDQPPTTPHACGYCGSEFVLEPGSVCKWCATIIGKPLRMKPNSPEERAFLSAWEARQSAGKTVPTLPATAERADRDSSSQTLPAYGTTT